MFFKNCFFGNFQGSNNIFLYFLILQLTSHFISIVPNIVVTSILAASTTVLGESFSFSKFSPSILKPNLKNKVVIILFVTQLILMSNFLMRKYSAKFYLDGRWNTERNLFQWIFKSCVTNYSFLSRFAALIDLRYLTFKLFI